MSTLIETWIVAELLVWDDEANPPQWVNTGTLRVLCLDVPAQETFEAFLQKKVRFEMLRIVEHFRPLDGFFSDINAAYEAYHRLMGYEGLKARVCHHE